ncbi:MAG: hypothetical protein L6Q57_08430 [Alphaproteobacteria bacterium]|nr:hypothetical protein [Alphaproteobacteria bacterium]
MTYIPMMHMRVRRSRRLQAVKGGFLLLTLVALIGSSLLLSLPDRSAQVGHMPSVPLKNMVQNYIAPPF